MKISMNENRTVTGTGAPVTPRQILETRVESAPDSVAFQYIKKKQTVSVTCGQFWREVNAMGVFFYRHGLYGKRIAVLGENSYEWILTWFAVVLSGNVVVPLDKDQRPEELAELLSRCEAEALVCSGQYYDVAETLHAADAVKRVLSMEDIPLILEHSSGLLDECGIETSGDTVCTIIFTSGTTGEQKGVMLTRRNLASDAFNASRSLCVKGSSVLTLPLHHTFGFTVGVLAAYLCGYPICISKSLRTYNKDLQSFAPVNLVLVPLYVETMYKAVWKTAREQGMEKKLRRMIRWSRALRMLGIDLREKLFRSVRQPFGGELRLIVCGGAFLDQRYIDGMDELGVKVLNGYGITECSPVVAVNRSDRRRKGSVGQPLPGVEVRILDNEICVRGENVMPGYFRDEKATAAVMADGWFHTGDLGYLDRDGFLFLTGRKKNLIVLSNGENVSAEELEGRLLRIPNVEEVVVRAEDDVITAEIYCLDKNGINGAVEQLNRELPPFKRIGRVVFRDEEFEKTTTRKIKRYESGKEVSHV